MDISATSSVTRPIASEVVDAAPDTAATTATQPADSSAASSFATAKDVPVVLDAQADALTVSTDSPSYRVSCSGGTLIATGDAQPGQSQGAKDAYATMQFTETHVESKEYQALTWAFDGAPDKQLATQVKADALAYLEKTPGLKDACDAAVVACGAVPFKIEGFKVDFALNHFETVGAAKGLKWGETEKQVKDTLKTSRAEAAEKKITVLDTKGGNGQKISGYVVANDRKVVNMDGSNNTIDMCSVPFPRPSGRSDAILGGNHNSGQVDMVGTVLVRAGTENTWTVKDPSQRPALNPPATEVAGLMKPELAAGAKKSSIVLEGNSADWSVLANGATATYTNTKTKTSVCIPAGAQNQVSYATSAALDKMASDLKAGVKPAEVSVCLGPNTVTKAKPKTVTPPTDAGTEPTTTKPPRTSTPITRTPEPTVESKPELSASFDQLLSSVPEKMAKRLILAWLKKLGITPNPDGTLASLKEQLAGLMKSVGPAKAAIIENSIRREAKKEMAMLPKSPEKLLQPVSKAPVSTTATTPTTTSKTSPFYDPYAMAGQPTTEQLVAAQAKANLEPDPVKRAAMLQTIDGVYESKKQHAVAAQIEQRAQQDGAARDMCGTEKERSRQLMADNGLNSAAINQAMTLIDEQFLAAKINAMEHGVPFTSFKSTAAEDAIAHALQVMHADMAQTGITAEAWMARQRG